MMRALTLVALPLVLAACGERSEEAAAPFPTAVPTQTLQADEAVSKAMVVVDANGLSNGGSGTRTFMRFGAPRAEVDVLAAKALKAEGKQSSNAECGAGPMDFTEIGPLQIAYQDGKFVGWYLSDGAKDSGAVVTSDGAAPGLALAQLKEWRQVRVITDSTLEGEFEYQTGDGGMITGFFEGSQSDGKIVALQAGLNCFFR